MARFDLVKSLQGLSTLELHCSKADIYFNAGAEYAGRAAGYDPITKRLWVMDRLFFGNTGCLTETGPGAARISARQSFQLHGGHSRGHRRHGQASGQVLDATKEKLKWGRIQMGPQYSVRDSQHLVRCGLPNEPQGIDNMVFTSFRYYLP